ncbi:bacterio-opsin activator domain-containing protein [Halorubrum rubrum]|uniref:Bacterio-opsin activator domain-containing protein n=1 Tax=Halorubrum rubrum TaxID=1126240 RepID=A0ABD5R1B9_9EURY|nr:bacterio-opsin activator domain-containing protein [Halorubrum rubrum]
MGEALPAGSYDALVTAAETYRAAIVVRLAGEAGLRTAEIPRVRPCDLGESPAARETFLLAVPAAEGSAEPGTAETGAATPADDVPIDRETVVPASLAADLRRYAESEGLEPDDPFVGVSPRRVQMLVAETAERARKRRDDPTLSSVTPRTLRGTFARRLLVDRGVGPHVVREAGGWETMDALDAHLDPLDGDAIAAAVADEGRGPSESAVGEDDDREETDRDGDSADSTLSLVSAFEAVAEAPGREAAFGTVVDRIVETDRWREARIRRSSAAGGLEEPEGAVEDDRWLSVAIGHRETTHGTLWLLPDGAPARPAERREAEALGRCLGLTVTAGRWRDLLHSDAVIEVEFHTAAAAAFLASTSAALDCRIELESTVAVSESTSRWYLSVTGAGPQAVADAVDAADGVSELRVIETREDGCAVSARATGGSIVRALTGHGATVREAIAEEGRVRVVADLPDGTDVRPIADDLREAFPDARLVSKESVARSPRTESAVHEEVVDRLTDRQWATLSAAYHSGYFDWPRGSTAEEVADAMDVSSPTFHNHLRKAERALLETLFEERDARDRP